MTIIGNFGVDDNEKCFRMNKDIVIPQLHHFSYDTYNQSEGRRNATRKYVCFFQGQIISGSSCSAKVRERIKDIGVNQSWPTHDETDFMYQKKGMMKESYFALCPAGWACWSSRLYHALFSNTIPVVVADPVVQPFQRFLNWSEFSVKIPSAEVLRFDAWAQNRFKRVVSLGDVRGTASERIGADEWFLLRFKRYVQEFERSVREGSAADVELTFIGRMRRQMAEVHEWFGWDAGRRRNAWKLLELELWCHTSAGRQHPSEVCVTVSGNSGSA